MNFCSFKEWQENKSTTEKAVEVSKAKMAFEKLELSFDKVPVGAKLARLISVIKLVCKVMEEKDYSQSFKTNLAKVIGRFAREKQKK